VGKGPIKKIFKTDNAGRKLIFVYSEFLTCFKKVRQMYIEDTQIKNIFP